MLIDSIVEANAIAAYGGARSLATCTDQYTLDSDLERWPYDNQRALGTYNFRIFSSIFFHFYYPPADWKK